MLNGIIITTIVVIIVIILEMSKFLPQKNLGERDVTQFHSLSANKKLFL